MRPRARSAPPGKRAPSPGAAPSRPRGRRGHRSRVLWILAAASLAALALLVQRFGGPWTPPDPLAGLTALAAADSADRLVERGLHFEALPYIERVERIAAAGSTDADFEARTATTGYNATIQVHARNGMVVPVTRSTIERIALIRSSMLRLERAERKADHPAQRRNIIVVRAGQLAVWGFVREGYADYRRANAIRPLEGRALSEAGWIEKMLGDPTQMLPAPPPERSSPSPAAE
ncbi:MAG: hypothetical protein ABIS67_01580 [Candidatus Eisenbacteria bacterium]